MYNLFSYLSIFWDCFSRHKDWKLLVLDRIPIRYLCYDLLMVKNHLDKDNHNKDKNNKDNRDKDKQDTHDSDKGNHNKDDQNKDNHIKDDQNEDNPFCINAIIRPL